MPVFRDCSDDLCLLRTLGLHLDRRLPGLRGNLRDLLVRNCLWVRDKHGRLIRLRPNRAQAEFAARATGRDIVLKARQLGITTWIAARFFLSTITRPGTVTVQVAHDQRAAEEIFRIVRRFLHHLPRCLRLRVLAPSRDNVGQLVFPLLDSEYRVESAADPNAGRGLTIHHLHCSEVARWPRDAAATLASLRAAVPPDGEIVLESTPNGAGGCFYDEWQRADSTGYARHFFPWWYAPEYAVDGRRPTADGSRGHRSSTFFSPPESASAPHGANENSPALQCWESEVIGTQVPEGRLNAVANVECQPLTADELTQEELSLVEKHGLSLPQIAFRRHMRASFRGLARQEFAEDPNSCFLASGECVFDMEVLNRRLAEIRDSGLGTRDSFVESRHNGRLLLWWPSRPGADYIIGVDPAGGGCEGDNSCAQVIERVSGLQCAELHGHIPPQELAARLAELGREYNNALIAVERNNHGHGVIAYLAAYEKYPRLYEQNRQAGWLTTAVSRPRMIEQLAALLARQPGLFASPRLLTECRTFVRQPDGAAAATAGAHDDCVLAMAIAQAVRLELAGGHRPAPELDFASLAR